MPAYVGSRKSERLERGGFKAIAGEIRSAVAHLEGGDEGGLRDFDFAELAHPLFALLLLFEELRLRGPATGMGQAGPARRGTLSATSRIGPKWESGLSWAASDEAPRVEGIA
jgi:hypothetical protein